MEGGRALRREKAGMTTFSEYDRYDGLGLAELVRRGEVTPRDLLFAAIERIDALDPKINAVVCQLFDKAREQVIAGLPEGPFHGVPFLLKDLYANYAGTPNGNGSRGLGGVVAEFDNELVARFRRAGLLILGKTNSPELGLSVSTEPLANGPTRNPWDLARTAGGSSGGAAAAVAAGMVPLAHGSDGGGSIRIPASACGLFGLKPTRARNPMGPDVGEGWAGLAAHHVITRSVRDSAAMLDATSGAAPGDPYCAPAPARPFLDEVGGDPGRLRIAWCAETGAGEPAHEDCRAALARFLAIAADQGHETEEASPAIHYDELRSALLTVIECHTAETLDLGHPLEQRALREDEVEAVTWLFAEAGRRHSPTDYIRAVNWIHEVGRKLAGFFERFDLYATPTLAQPPVPLGTIDMAKGDLEGFVDAAAAFSPFTALFNISGQPAASIPLHWNREGLPIGVQLAARFGEEATLIRVASRLEQAAPWFDRRPQL